jgi:hypothetical protein
MLNKILVAYASRAGSTAGMAEAIGTILTDKPPPPFGPGSIGSIGLV